MNSWWKPPCKVNISVWAPPFLGPPSTTWHHSSDKCSHAFSVYFHVEHKPYVRVSLESSNKENHSVYLLDFSNLSTVWEDDSSLHFLIITRVWTFCNLADALHLHSARCNTQALHLPDDENEGWVSDTTIPKGNIYDIITHISTTSNKQLVHGYKPGKKIKSDSWSIQSTVETEFHILKLISACMFNFIYIYNNAVGNKPIFQLKNTYTRNPFSKTLLQWNLSALENKPAVWDLQLERENTHFEQHCTALA